MIASLATVALVLANLLAFGAGLILVGLVSSTQRWGPEGPVGAHMVTGPLALGLAVGIGLAVGAGSWDAAGLSRWWAYAVLPGLVVAVTVAAILPAQPVWRTLARVSVVAAVVGAALMLHGGRLGGGRVPSIAGLVLVGGVAASGYGLLLATWFQSMRNEVLQARHDRERESEFEQKQAEFQRGEWAKLPADAKLWQLIQFAYAFAPEVREQCRQRIAALPDPTAAMRDLLGTGWASHALRYLAELHPGSTAPLAEALSRFLLAEVERWRSQLDPRSNPGSWYANLLGPIEAAERVARDGGDVREAMAAWAGLLDGKRGLESLARRARSLANPR